MKQKEKRDRHTEREVKKKKKHTGPLFLMNNYFRPVSFLLVTSVSTLRRTALGLDANLIPVKAPSSWMLEASLLDSVRGGRREEGE